MTLLPFAKQLDALYKREAPTHARNVGVSVEEVPSSPSADPCDALASLSTLQQLQLCSGSSVMLSTAPQQHRARLVPLRLAASTPASSSSDLSISPLLAFNMGLPVAINALLASPQAQAAATKLQLRLAPAAAAPPAADPSLAPAAAPHCASPACASFARFAKVGVPHISTLATSAGGDYGGVITPEEGGAGQWDEEEAGVLQAVQAFFRSRRRWAGPGSATGTRAAAGQTWSGGPVEPHGACWHLARWP
jgi:hypothetical protein